MDPYFNWTLSLSLAALFLAAAMQKMRAFREWPGVVRNFQLLPEPLVGAAAAVVPAAETLSAAMLIATRTRPAGALAAAVLLVLFAAALAVNIRRGRTEIDCGCFGTALRQPIAPWMVARNLILALLALAILVPPAPRPLGVIDCIACVGTVLTLAFLYPVAAMLLGAAAHGARTADLAAAREER
jgi:uncharacterized membrane protein YphA (DoxX/SURF4 family)